MSGFNLLRLSLRSHSTLKSSLLISQNTIARNANKIRLSSTTASSSHSSQWNVERYVSVSLLAIIPASLFLENPIMDYVLAATVISHSTWGLKMIVTDYIHGNLTKPAVGVVYGLSMLAFIGCCYFIYADIGLSKALKKLWAL
jgi:succinate dehydrogenase (ubiquinone) membrane anchor subunit